MLSDRRCHCFFYCQSSNTRKNWGKVQGESTNPPSFQQIKSFLHTQILTLESIEGSSKVISSSQSKGQTPQGKQSREHSSVHSLQASPKRDGKKGAQSCSFCQSNHDITFCNKFKYKGQYNTISERKDFVKKESLCQNCLGKHSF